MDSRLREFARRWRETGRIEDEGRYLVERVRVGDLPQRNLEFAAYCGHPGAKAALQDESPMPRIGMNFLRGLRAFGQELWVAAVAGILKHYMGEWPATPVCDQMIAALNAVVRGSPAEGFGQLEDRLQTLNKPSGIAETEWQRVSFALKRLIGESKRPWNADPVVPLPRGLPEAVAEELRAAGALVEITPGAASLRLRCTGLQPTLVAGIVARAILNLRGEDRMPTLAEIGVAKSALGEADTVAWVAELLQGGGPRSKPLSPLSAVTRWALNSHAES